MDQSAMMSQRTNAELTMAVCVGTYKADIHSLSVTAQKACMRFPELVIFLCTYTYLLGSAARWINISICTQ